MFIRLFMVCELLWSLSWAFPQSPHLSMSPEELQYHFKTDDVSQVPEYEVSSLHQQDQNGNYKLSLFGKILSLDLKKNEYVSASNESEKCHYLHTSDELVAAISLCGGESDNQPKSLFGYVFTKEEMYVLTPLTGNLRPSSFAKRSESGAGNQVGAAIAKRGDMDTEHRTLLKNIMSSRSVRSLGSVSKRNGPVVPGVRPNYVACLYLGVFVDSGVRRIIERVFNDPSRVRVIMESYVNGIQALYHALYENLLCFSITKLEIYNDNNEPSALRASSDANVLLTAFCDFQKKLPDTSTFDLALLISSKDMHMNGNNNVMGLAHVGTACTKDYACVIIEMGVQKPGGRGGPTSRGIGSVTVAAHEIGHSLGMRHDDSPGVGCASGGVFIEKSAVSRAKGQTNWSSCSKATMIEAMATLSCLHDNPSPIAILPSIHTMLPGDVCDADCQCQVYFGTKLAKASTRDLADRCTKVLCETDSVMDYSNTAYDGTACGTNMHCIRGQCIRDNRRPEEIKQSYREGVAIKEPPKKVPKEEAPKDPGKPFWTNWKDEGTCAIQAMDNNGRECLVNTKGVLRQTRLCLEMVGIGDYTKPMVRDNSQCGAESGVKVDLCSNPTSTCSVMKSVAAYSNRHCNAYNDKMKSWSSGALSFTEGRQPKYSSSSEITQDPGRGCQVQCKRADNGEWYHPINEMGAYTNDPELTVFFPEGALCHQDNQGHKYYCLNHLCEPDNNRGSRSSGKAVKTMLFDKSVDENGDLTEIQEELVDKPEMQA